MKTILIIGTQGKLGSSLSKKYTENFRIIPLDIQDYYREDHMNFIDYILNKLKHNTDNKIDIILFAYRHKSHSKDNSDNPEQPAELLKALEVYKYKNFSYIESHYNLLERVIKVSLLPLVSSAKISLIPYRAIARGVLSLENICTA